MVFCSESHTQYRRRYEEFNTFNLFLDFPFYLKIYFDQKSPLSELILWMEHHSNWLSGIQLVQHTCLVSNANLTLKQVDSKTNFIQIMKKSSSLHQFSYSIYYIRDKRYRFEIISNNCFIL
jgi:hypothetical protein